MPNSPPGIELRPPIHQALTAKDVSACCQKTRMCQLVARRLNWRINIFVALFHKKSHIVYMTSFVLLFLLKEVRNWDKALLVTSPATSGQRILPFCTSVSPSAKYWCSILRWSSQKSAAWTSIFILNALQNKIFFFSKWNSLKSFFPLDWAGFWYHAAPAAHPEPH